MDKCVSIVVPVYNVERYLHECLDSIIKQSYRNLEVILIDDGSTDNSGIICDEYAQLDSRIRVVHQSNAGAANAKNAGLDLASGDYVAFVDSDDYVEKNWIETMMSTAVEYQADIVECAFDKVFVNHREDGCRQEKREVFSAEEYMKQYLSEWTSSLFWNKLFRAELTKNVRFRKERRCIDDEFLTYKLLTKADTITRIPDILYHYRQRASGAVLSEKNRKQITDDSLEILVERYEWVCGYFPKLKKIYLEHDVDILFYFARDFDFTKETAKKFHKIAKYYFWKSVFNFPGRVTMQYAWRLLWIREDKLLNKEIRQGKMNRDDCFI